MLLGWGIPAAPVAQSQGITLGYGVDVTSTISAAVPLANFVFNGIAGDLVRIRVTPLPGAAGALDPMITLTAPGGSVFTNSDTVLNEDKTDGQLSLFLPENGQYALVIGGENMTTGDYSLQIYGRPPIEGETLVLDEPVAVIIPLGQLIPQTLRFTASETCDTTLTLTADSPGAPFTFRYAARLYTEAGETVAQMRGGHALENRFTVEAGSGRYEIEVFSDDALREGALIAVITCADAQPVCSGFLDVPPVFATPTPTATAPAGQMILMSIGGMLTDGVSLTGTLPNPTSVTGFGFSGEAGDRVVIQAIAGTGQLDPTLTLLDANNALLTGSDDDIFAPNGADATLALYLPQTGSYTVLLGAQGGSSGAFAIRMSQRPASAFSAAVLPADTAVPVVFEAQADPSAIAPSQFFTFEAQACPTTLTVLNPEGFPYALTVRNPEGSNVMQTMGAGLPETRVTVAPNSGRYEVEVLSARPEAAGSITLQVGCAESGPGCSGFVPRSTPRPRATPTAARTLPPCPAATPTAAGAAGTPNPLLSYSLRTGPRVLALTAVARQTPGAAATPCATLTPVNTQPANTRPPQTRPPASLTPTSNIVTQPPPPFCGDGICQWGVSDFCDCAIDCANDRVFIDLCTTGATHTPPPPPPPFCGDGICQFGSGDGCDCTVDCANDPGWLLECRPPSPPPFCGDGICQFGVSDFCDCTVDCANDPGWLGQCQPRSFCGDGVCNPELGENVVQQFPDGIYCTCQADCAADPACVAPG